MPVKISEPTGIKYITWIDHPEHGVKGYYLRCFANRAKGDGYLQKLFPVRKYQSKSNALRAAKLHRALWWRRLPEHLKTMRHSSSAWKKGKISGAGVYPLWITRNGYQFLHVQAAWQDKDGKQRRKSFSASRYGHDEAYAMAHAKRAEMVKGRITV